MLQSDYIDLIKSKFDLKSDAAVGRKLKLSKAAISLYRNNEAQFGADTAMKIAELLDIPPENVAADMMASRSTDKKVKAKWMKRGAILPCMLAVLLTHQFPQTNDNQFNHKSPNIHYAHISIN